MDGKCQVFYLNNYKWAPQCGARDYKSSTSWMGCSSSSKLLTPVQLPKGSVDILPSSRISQARDFVSTQRFGTGDCFRILTSLLILFSNDIMLPCGIYILHTEALSIPFFVFFKLFRPVFCPFLPLGAVKY